MEKVVRPLDYSPEALEDEIACLEKAMDIKTPPDRFLEACLLVDQKFVVAALLTESDLPLERMFGNEAWAGYLQARLLTRDADEEYGFHDAFAIGWLLEDLDVCLTAERGDEIGGERLDGDHGLGGQFVDGEFMPLDLTPAQVYALNQLPWVSFLSADDPERPYRGFVKYPDMEAIYAQSEFFGVFGTLMESNANAYQDAAVFQQSLIQLHLFKSGVNGRKSRIGMNWRLVRRGYSPSILARFDNDLFTTPEEWMEHVRSGSELYDSIRQRINEGGEDPIDLLGLRDIKTFHDKYYKPSLGIVVPVFQPNAIHSHANTDSYLIDLEQAFQRHTQSGKLGNYAYRLSSL